MKFFHTKTDRLEKAFDIISDFQSYFCFHHAFYLPRSRGAGRSKSIPSKMNLLGTLAADWAGYLPAQRVFYGIGCLAAFLIVILGIFQLVGMEIHADIDHPDHAGASLISVKPITGFFFGFGWAGGYCMGEMSFFPSFGLAILAGLCAMFLIWGIVCTFIHFQNDGSLRIESAIGKEGIVYTTIDPATGGQVQVTLNTGLETLPAVTRETEPISTGKTVTVIRLDGPNLLVETKKT
jgi:membrane-bound ClpP family serine protease